MSLVVDVHSHIYPAAYLDLLASRNAIPRIDERDGVRYFVIFPEEERTGGRPIGRPMWRIEDKLAFMDEAGIDRTVVSLGNPWLDPLPGPESIALARLVNAELAGLEALTGGRVHALGILPNAAPADAAAIVREVAATRGLYGLISGCRICGLRLDDPALEPVWVALADTALPVFFHPHNAPAIEELDGFGTALPLGIGFPAETTIAIARMVMAGVLLRHPGLRVMAAHSGGMLPFLAARLDVTWRGDPIAQERLPVPPSGELAKLWLDTVSYHPRAMHAAADLVGNGRLLFGTDHPFFKERPKDLLAGVAAAFEGRDLMLAAGENARTLFRLP